MPEKVIRDPNTLVDGTALPAATATQQGAETPAQFLDIEDIAPLTAAEVALLHYGAKSTVPLATIASPAGSDTLIGVPTMGTKTVTEMGGLGAVAAYVTAHSSCDCTLVGTALTITAKAYGIALNGTVISGTMLFAPGTMAGGLPPQVSATTPLATTLSPGTVPHYPLLAADLNVANLTNHDKLRYEALTVLGGDGSLYTDFFDDFDNMVVTGDGTPSTSTARPLWGTKSLGTDVNVGQVAKQKPSHFSLNDAASDWGHWNVLPVGALGAQVFYFTVKGFFYTATQQGDAHVQLANNVSSISIGINHASDVNHVVLNNVYSGAPVILLAESTTVPIQVDVYCLGDSVMHYRVNGGIWQTWAYSYGLTPSTPTLFECYQDAWNMLSLDWVGLFALKS